MKLIVNEHHHCDLIEIVGRIDSYSAPQIETVLDDLISDDHYNIIVDLQNVNFISSSGMLTFVKIQRKFKQQNKGEVIFIRVPELIYRSFEIAGFNTIFKFFDAFETAQANFSSPEE